MSGRGKIEAKLSKACPDCPWRASNRGRKTSGGWYTLKNIRRLWAGLRSGDAPGMTCHPTDPDNPMSDQGKQAPEGNDVAECYGSLLLVAREMGYAQHLCENFEGEAAREYRKQRPKGLTRWGLAHWVNRFAIGEPFTGTAPLPTEWTEDKDIQHPDFQAPKLSS